MAYGVNAPFGLRPVSSINGGSWTEKTNEYFITASADGTDTLTHSIFTGDPIKFNKSKEAHHLGTIDRYNPGFSSNTPSTFSIEEILGVFQGCEYYNTSGQLIKSPFWPASTNVLAGTKIKAFVIDDPNVVFDIQISTSINAVNNAFVSQPYALVTNTTNTNNQIGTFGTNFALNFGGGENFNTVEIDGVNAGYANNPASGDTRTGQSAYYLDASTSTALNNDHDYNKTLATLPLKTIGYSLDPKNVADSRLTLETTPFLNVRVIINNHCFKQGVLGTSFV